MLRPIALSCVQILIMHTPIYVVMFSPHAFFQDTVLLHTMSMSSSLHSSQPATPTANSAEAKEPGAGAARVYQSIGK
eukprot:scaffold1483_cov145-Skeletonema_marinoi.AAC.2